MGLWEIIKKKNLLQQQPLPQHSSHSGGTFNLHVNVVVSK